MKPELLIFCCLGLLAACRKQAPEQPQQDPEPAVANRIAVPAAVRRNLGIEFAKVERRRVSQTLRVAGWFELLPAGRHEHRTPLAGRVEILVQPLQRVEAGAPLYRLEAPEWQRMRRELGEIETAKEVAHARIAALEPLLVAHETHEQSLREASAVLTEHVKTLEATAREVGGQAQVLAAARMQLSLLRAQTTEAAEQHASTGSELTKLRAEVRADQRRFELAVAAAATVVGLPESALREATDQGGAKEPAWRRISAIEVRAARTGIVDKLPVATGGWVETGELVLAVTDLSQVRFRARGLQSDLPSLQDGLPAVVVPARAGAEASDRVRGTLLLGVEADPAQRTIDLFVQPSSASAWCRPGVAGFVEVETRGGAAAELAIPLSAVLQDGLQRVFFRRDPADPDKVIRVEADLGLDDGRWVEVKSDLVDGDEVVLAGA
ncbi:MAG TPA: efflux RND transporter periplasmic adaptor subunit, partial [Planctomycetota bacterium]|nr:efflux RND transporter periplasmic adaptor subunit [Planctomycetota bacterium]